MQQVGGRDPGGGHDTRVKKSTMIMALASDVIGKMVTNLCDQLIRESGSLTDGRVDNRYQTK